ncbi:hypothetical protein ACRWT1_23655 [Escherichia coli]
MMSLWDALRMNMMISYQELVRTFPKPDVAEGYKQILKDLDKARVQEPIADLN